MTPPLSSPEDVQTAEFNELLRVHSETAYRMAYQLTGGREAEAGDLVQEVFLKIWRQWKTQRPYSIKGWIYRVLHNLHLDAIRRRTRHPSIPLQVSNEEDFSLEETLPEKGVTFEVELEQRDTRKQVARALAQIDPEFRAPVVLCDMEGMPYDDIAKILNCPVGTIRSRIHRGRSQLRRLLTVAAVAAALGIWGFIQHCRTLQARGEAQLAAGTRLQRIAPHAHVALHGHHDLSQDVH